VIRLWNGIETDTRLPGTYKDFHLQKILVHAPRGIGIYENARGERVLIKSWKGSAQTYEYYQLVKEIHLYTVLHRVIDRIGSTLAEKYKRIRIPRILAQDVSSTRVFVVYEYIDDCIHLRDVQSLKEKTEIFTLAVEYWRYIGEHFTPEEKALLPKRTLGGTIVAYVVSLVYAIARYPSEVLRLARSVPIVVAGLRPLAVHWNEGLVHRDFHFENVLVSKEHIVIIDFGDNAFTSMMQIFTHALHWEWYNNDSRTIIMQSLWSLYGLSQETVRAFHALFTMSAVQLLHDTESLERLKLNFTCFSAALEGGEALLPGASQYSVTHKSGVGAGVYMRTLKKLLKGIRSAYTLWLRPKSRYPLLPISTKFGFDRGTPIDRFYIERFLHENALHIHGICLEIGNNEYTKRYGGHRVTRSDVLDIDRNNKAATLYGDLRNLSHVPDDSYDCIILTHTLGIIDDQDAAAREILRILKPGGTALITVSSMGVMQDPSQCFWRYTPASLAYVFTKGSRPAHIAVSSYGNVLAGQAFWVGFAQEEFTEEELLHNDPRYAVITAAVLHK
jgi:SAM-dependent methyltransferase